MPRTLFPADGVPVLHNGLFPIRQCLGMRVVVADPFAPGLFVPCLDVLRKRSRRLLEGRGVTAQAEFPVPEALWQGQAPSLVQASQNGELAVFVKDGQFLVCGGDPENLSLYPLVSGEDGEKVSRFPARMAGKDHLGDVFVPFQHPQIGAVEGLVVFRISMVPTDKT